MFGERLKDLRKSNNLSQEELASQFKVQKSSISNWETNKSTPSFELLKEISKYFNVSTDFLLGIDESDKDKIEKLEIALKEAGINDLDKALKIIDVLKENNDEK